MEVWYNPACSKCRGTAALLNEHGVTFTERRYLDDPPTEADIEHVLGLLKAEPWDITRMDDPRAKELGLADAPRDRTAWVKALAENPSLLQRPIVVTADGRAVVGRPPEKVLDLLR